MAPRPALEPPAAKHWCFLIRVPQPTAKTESQGKSSAEEQEEGSSVVREGISLKANPLSAWTA